MNIIELALFCKMFKALNGGSGGDTPDAAEMKAGLYQTGAIALYQSGDRDSASAMMKTSWEDLVADGVIAVSEGAELPEGAQLNEYGFYYGVEYGLTNDGITIGFTFNEDGSAVFNQPDQPMELPAGTAVYSYRTIDVSAMGMIFVVSDDGTTIKAEGMTLSIGSALARGTVYLPKSNIDNTSSTIDGDLVIVDGATGFEFSAFSGQTLLTGIMLPDSVTGFMLEEFVDCSNLTDVVLSNNLLRIGTSTFMHCVGLRSIDIPNSVTVIDQAAFSGCKGLVSVVIPDSVSLIESAAFADCTLLESITIGNGVTKIGRQTFDGDSSLRNITFNGTMEQWNAIEKESYWRRSVPATYVQCTDGQVAPD